MLDLASANAETFSPTIGQTFEVVFSDGRLPLTLAEVRRLGSETAAATARQPFGLTFHGAPPLRLPQSTYRLENSTLGMLEIFLVQTGADTGHSHFEAIFT